jgi:ankyrin repeat protein
MAKKDTIMKGNLRKSIVPAEKGELSAQRNPVAAAAEAFALKAKLRRKQKEKTNKIFSAAKKGMWGTALSLVDGNNINERGPHGMTLLMEAAAQGELTVMQRLVRNGAFKGTEDDFGRSAITHALLGSHPEAAKLLQKLGASWARDLYFAVRDRRVLLANSIQETFGVSDAEVADIEFSLDPGRGPALRKGIEKISGDGNMLRELTVMFQPEKIKNAGGADRPARAPEAPAVQPPKKRPISFRGC